MSESEAAGRHVRAPTHGQGGRHELPNGVAKAAAAWDNALAELFVSRTDPLIGRMVATLTCGLLMQAVLSDDMHSRADIEALFRRALESAGASRR